MRTPGTRGQAPGAVGQRGQQQRPRFNPNQTRQQWRQNWDRHRGNWRHSGNWSNKNHWNWNNTYFFGGTFFYPGFWFGFNYGYWGFNYCGNYCIYSPFYYYGYPYLYAPRVAVVEVPTYTYTTVPAYQYGSGYYMSPGAYTGLDAALSDIRTAWLDGRADLMLKHIDPNTQVAIYLDGEYSYSVPGSDYTKMVEDAIGHIRTVSLTFSSVERRSDGAFMASGTQEFYDVNNELKKVNVSFTVALQKSNWVIVATGSSEE